MQYNWLPDNFTDLSTAVSVFFTCLCAHVNIPKMTSELKFPTKSKFGNKLKKMDRVNNISFVACTVVYFLVGVCGYLAFGANTKGNLLSNFADLNVWYLNIVKVAYAFVALFSYPVLSFSPLVSIDKTFFKQPLSCVTSCVRGIYLDIAGCHRSFVNSRINPGFLTHWFYVWYCSGVRLAIIILYLD